MTTATSDVELALGRRERPLPLSMAKRKLKNERILITGANGSIGQALGLDGAIPTDLDDLDITREDAVKAIFRHQPTLILHLAGVKYAPQGEDDPSECLNVNAIGTQRVVNAGAMCGARVVTVSTCKAADPETCYGATKLIAERITLNAGGTVARFFNVVETAGNVFETWRGVPWNKPIRYTRCKRFFISRAEAVSLLLNAAVMEPGRYAFDPGLPRDMKDVAAALYPDRALEPMPPRRGDRIVEPLHGEMEHIVAADQHFPGTLLRIFNPHD